MPVFRKTAAALVLTLLFAFAASAALYVTDQLEITLRSGPGLDYKILRMLPTGMALERLEDREGWSRVRTAAGEEGWVVARYLAAEPPKGPRLEAALRDLETLRGEADRQKAELVALRSERDRLDADNQRLGSGLAAVEQEFAEWKRVNQDVVALRERTESLRSSQEGIQAEVEGLRAENESLRTRETFYWFFSGVVVLLLGWVLGYVYASSRQRAKSHSRLRL